MTKEEIINKYEAICKIIRECTLSGDYKKNNKQTVKKKKLFNLLENNRILAGEVLSVLLQSTNVVTQITAANTCLKLNLFTNKAKDILNQIATNNNFGIFAFNAELCLKVYNEKKSRENNLFQEK